jgi:hypothetical protein
VKATRAFGVPLNLSTGDSTTALIELENDAAGTPDTTINTPCDWQLAISRTTCHAESVSEACTIACRARRDSEAIARPADNHLSCNLDYSAKAALGQHLSDPSKEILQTVAASGAVFNAVDVNGAWITV